MKCVVTGAARGLGERIAARLVSDGGDVALIDVDEGVNATAERLQAERPGSLALAVRCDVSDEAGVDAAVREVAGRLGGIDLLVNNAGIGGPSTTVMDTSLEEFRRVLDVNLIGTFLMARACARVMAEGAGGCIVNIGSIFGQQGVGERRGYCASKGGVALLTHSLALEVAPPRHPRQHDRAGQHADGDASGGPADRGRRPRRARSRRRSRRSARRSPSSGTGLATTSPERWRGSHPRMRPT